MLAEALPLLPHTREQHKVKDQTAVIFFNLQEYTNLFTNLQLSFHVKRMTEIVIETAVVFGQLSIS
jgi:hypothetical protein